MNIRRQLQCGSVIALTCPLLTGCPLLRKCAREPRGVQREFHKVVNPPSHPPAVSIQGVEVNVAAYEWLREERLDSIPSC